MGKADLFIVLTRQVDILREDYIPLSKLKDEKHMDKVRSLFSLNINFPGVIEMEDPNKFIVGKSFVSYCPGLRPVEEFRYLPQIPISDQQMRQYKKEKELYHSKKFKVFLHKENILQACKIRLLVCANRLVVFVSAGYICYLLISLIMEKDEEMTLEYERLKLRRAGKLQ